jgi:hypothetical protein
VPEPRAETAAASDDEPVEAPAAHRTEDGTQPGEMRAAVSGDTDGHRPGDADEGDQDEERRDEEDGPIHRRLIRASLPKNDGAPPPARQMPDFTIRQPAGRPVNRFRPRGPRGGSGGGGQQFQGNRSGGGNMHGGPRGNGGGMRSSGGGRPQGQGGGQMRRNGPGGRRRSK